MSISLLRQRMIDDMAARHFGRGHRNLRQERPYVRVAHRAKHGLERAWAPGRAEQPRPPRSCLRIAGKAGAEYLDPDEAASFGDEAFPPRCRIDRPVMRTDGPASSFLWPLPQTE